MNEILSLAWKRWKILAQINGDYIARFITNAFYFTILVPFAIGLQLLSDPLQLRKGAPSRWLDRKSVGSSINDARSQS